MACSAAETVFSRDDFPFGMFVNIEILGLYGAAVRYRRAQSQVEITVV